MSQGTFASPNNSLAKEKDSDQVFVLFATDTTRETPA
jgi:hypothetical protein